MQTYLIRFAQCYVSTLKTFTIPFDVMNFQNIGNPKNSKFTYNNASKYMQIYRSSISPNNKIWSQMLSKNARNSPKSPNKMFVAKCFQNSPDFRNLAINTPTLQCWTKDHLHQKCQGQDYQCKITLPVNGIVLPVIVWLVLMIRLESRFLVFRTRLESLWENLWLDSSHVFHGMIRLDLTHNKLLESESIL